MKITEVRLKKREGDERFLASGSVTLEGEFVVSGIKVMKSKEGELFIAYPSWKNSDGQYKDVCFPMSRTLREDITVAVLAEYEKI
ncbi:MAG: SpoVG family protein [Lachnospiraceae bacterium]|jgi:stage V sporulation protein G|nr:SpoVG family protein [Lachnospiraceae bacterium]